MRLGIAGLVCWGSAAFAQTIWDGGGGNNLWTNATNWNNNASPGNPSGSVLNFAGNTRLTPDMNANWSVNGISFTSGAGAFTLGSTGGSTLTINTSSGIVNLDNSTQTISSAVTLGAAQTWSISSTGNLTVSGNVNNGGFLLTTSAGASTARNLALSGVISGTGGLTTGGTGNTTLSGANANTYTGTTTINSGTLSLSKTASVTAIAGNIVIGDGAGTDTLRTTTANQISSTSALTFTAGGTPSFNVNSVSQTVGSITSTNTSANITLGTGTLTVGGDNLSTTYAGTILSTTGGGVVKTGSGTLTLNSTASTFTGQMHITNGTVTINNIANSGSNSAIGRNATIELGNVTESGTLQYSGPAAAVNRGLTLAGTTGGGTVDTTGGSGALTLTGTVNSTGAGAKTLTLTGTSTFTNTLSGVISENSTTNTTSIVKSGTGTWALTGANTFTGTTTINQGILSINDEASLGANPGVFNAGQLTLNGGTLNTSASFTINDNKRGVTVASGGGTFDTDAATTLVISNPIAGSGTLTKTGTGALNMNGPDINTHTGNIVVSAGTLRVNRSNANAAIGDTAAVTVANGATLIFNNGLAETIGSLAGDGTVNNNDAVAMTLTTGGDNTSTLFSGVLQNSGGDLSIAKTGTGTFTLSGANTYAGATTINAGTLSIASEGNLGANPGVFNAGQLTLDGGTLNTSATFAIDDANRGVTLGASGGTFNPDAATTLTVANAIAGSGALTKSGTGNLTLSAANSFAGAVNIDAGTLTVSNASALGSGTAGVTVADGATLSLQGGFTFDKGNLTLTGTGAGGNGALDNVSGNNRYGNHISLGGNTTIGTQSGLLSLGAVSGSFSPSGDTEPVFPTNEAGFITIGGQTLTFTGAGTGIFVENRIRDFAGQTARTSYDFTAPATLTLTGSPETTNPGNVIVNMTGGGYVQYYAWANSYTGSTTVQQGQLRLDTLSNSAAPHDAVTASFHSINGNLIIGNADSNAASVKLYANETIAPGATVTLYKDGTLDLAGKSQTIGDTVNGVSAGGLVFNGGNVTLGSGTLYLGADVTVNASAGNPVSITTNSTGSVSLTLNKDNTSDAALGNQTRTFTVGNGGNAYDLTIGGVVKTGSLVKAGTGVMMMNGTNTYLGTTNVTAGILNIQSGTSGSYSGLGSGDGTDALGTTVASGATLQLQGGISLTTEKLNLSGAGYNSLGALNNAGGDNIFGTAGNTYINLNADSTITTTNGNLSIPTNIGSTSNNKAITFDTASGTTITVSGGINTGSGATTTVNKTGAGTLILSGNSSYEGATTVSTGVLSLQHSDGLGAVSAGTVVTSGAELQLSNVANGNLTIGGEALTLNGSGVGATQGALRNIAGNNSFGGLVTLGSASTVKSDANTLTLSGGTSSANYALTVTGAGNTTISGNMSHGTGSLTKDGAGTLTFSGTTGTVGQTHLNAGNMTVGTGGSSTLNTAEFDSAISTTLTIASGGMVSSTYGNGTTTYFSGALAGAGIFEKQGAGTLVFNHSTGFDASSLTLNLAGGTVKFIDTNPSGTSEFKFGTIHITGNTILDFGNSAGTFLTSASLVIDAGVTVTVNNWISVANDTALSTVWYATSTVNAGTLGGIDQVGGTPLNQISFTNYNGLTTTWVSTNHNGWFDHEIRPTPEPATYGAIFLSGCLGLLGWRRYRGRQTAAT